MNASQRTAQVDPAPVTYFVDSEWAKRELTYSDLVALHDLILSWALYDDRLTPDRRTWLVKVACDYEAVARWLGPEWQASDPSRDLPAVKYLAVRFKRQRG